MLRGRCRPAESLPFCRALANPARVRSRRISRSNSAKMFSSPAIARPAGVVRSSASVSDTKPTPRCPGFWSVPAVPSPSGPGDRVAKPGRCRSAPRPWLGYSLPAMLAFGLVFSTGSAGHTSLFLLRPALNPCKSLRRWSGRRGSNPRDQLGKLAPTEQIEGGRVVAHLELRRISGCRSVLTQSPQKAKKSRCSL